MLPEIVTEAYRSNLPCAFAKKINYFQETLDFREFLPYIRSVLTGTVSRGKDDGALFIEKFVDCFLFEISEKKMNIKRAQQP